MKPLRRHNEKCLAHLRSGTAALSGCYHFDRQRLYAAAGIILYWIINLVERQVEVYEQPLLAEGRYALRTDFRPGQGLGLTLSAQPPIEFAVADMLAPQDR